MASQQIKPVRIILVQLTFNQRLSYRQEACATLGISWKYSPTVVRITQRDRALAWRALSATATFYSDTCIVLYMHRCTRHNYRTACIQCRAYPQQTSVHIDSVTSSTSLKWCSYNTAAGSFNTEKLCSRFVSTEFEFYWRKQQIPCLHSVALVNVFFTWREHLWFVCPRALYKQYLFTSVLSDWSRYKLVTEGSHGSRVQ